VTDIGLDKRTNASHFAVTSERTWSAMSPPLLLQFAHSFSALLALGFVFSAMTLVWLSAYAFAVARAGDFLGRSRIRRGIEAATGVVLVALGFRVATEPR
jgi:threonine/homoserine/homoserine lactone efflux protein